ncbi:F-box protein At1g47056-like [Telopea speciosissima]|uniref:F-box protein At1g47056-like n=1 Tax=Telopea speciosissima TaxID=54955 RepID=UPI001CC5B7B8|nr:F-box protein At1g47056-like [Telopea speciosissima]
MVRPIPKRIHKDHNISGFSDVCLAYIFNFLGNLDLKSCSLVCGHINAVLDHSSSLEELSLIRLDVGTRRRPSASSSSWSYSTSPSSLTKKSSSTKSLRTLKIFECSGDCDKILETVVERVNSTGLVEVHLLDVFLETNVALAAISNFSNLEILHIAYTRGITTKAGLVSIFDHCMLLKELHIRSHGEEDLTVITEGCPLLQELVLISVNTSCLSLSLLAANCKNLKRLALYWCDTFGDPEISCVAAECIAL